MKHLRTLFILLLLCSTASSSTGKTVEINTLSPTFGKRVVSDLARLNVLSESPKNQLLFGRIDPKSIEYFGLDSGDSGIFKTPKGRIIKVPKNKNMSILLGSFETCTTMWGTKTSLPSYQWNGNLLKAFNSWGSYSEEARSFSPFYFGGTIIFGYNEKAEGAAMFNPVYLIPDEWANFVLPAFKFQQTNKSLFDDKNVVKNQKRLLELTSDANPFNAAAAARVLAPARGLDAKFVREHVAKSPNYQQAIFTYLAFKNAHPLQQESIDAALIQNIDKATSSAPLKWITLGINTAQNDDGNSYFALKDRVKAILQRVDKKQKELKTKTPDDEYVSELLIAAQIRERPKTPVGKTSNF